MSRIQFIVGAALGLACGLFVAYLLLNRYEALQVKGYAGRLDKLTGKACVFIKPTDYMTRAGIERIRKNK